MASIQRFAGVVMLASLFVLGAVAPASSVATEDVTEIWTDFNGGWNSSTTDANAGVGSYTLAKPDTQHNLLAFTWGATTYSTGVDDASLTSDGVSFTADQWSALPIDEITYSDPCSNQKFGVLIGSAEDAPSKAGACYSAEENAALLTSGSQGLNLGSGLVNIPSGNARDFPVTSIEDLEIADGVPDILFTQVAAAGGDAGQKVSLRDSDNDLVGNEIVFTSADVANVSPTGFWSTNIYTMDGADWQLGQDRAIRLWAVELDDFGITGDNADDVTTVQWQSTSTDADMAFLGYNTTALSIELVAVSGQVPDVMVVDPRAQDLDFPSPLTFEDSINAMICFIQVADSSGSALSGSPNITISRTTTVAGVTENTTTNLWRYSGPRESVADQVESIQVSGTGGNSVSATGSKWLRVTVTSDTTGESACTDSEVEIDEVLEIRSLSLSWSQASEVTF